MTHKIYDKMVRDGIPDILDKNGIKYKVEYLTTEDSIIKYTLRKLSEEVSELTEALMERNREHVLNELADVISVVMKIAIDCDIQVEEVLIREEMKSEANGFFFDNCVLKYVVEPDDE